MRFDKNSDIKEFSEKLEMKLFESGESSLSNGLHEWNMNFFTTSSEYLGELKIILEEIYILKSLDNETRQDIRECLLAINKAFQM